MTANSNPGDKAKASISNRLCFLLVSFSLQQILEEMKCFLIKIISRTLTVQFSSVQSLSCVQLFATPWTAARQASLSIANSWSLLKLMSIESVMPSNRLILCHPLLLLPLIFPSIRAFSDESALRIRWPKFQLHHQSFQ